MNAVTEQSGIGDQAGSSADGRSNQYLTFLLGEEEYGVDILRVQEIRGWDRATPIPNTADYVRGVINLRGAVVPVIDLRRRFKKEPIAYTSTTVVIVVRVLGGQAEKTIGLIVDAVSDVRNASNDELRAASELGLGQMEFVKGLAMLNDSMIILLDVDRLVDVTIDGNLNSN